MSRSETEQAAVEWALDQVDSQLRTEPVRRLRDPDQEFEWSFDSPNGIGVFAQAIRVSEEAGSVTFDLSAIVSGWIGRHAQVSRRVHIVLDGDSPFGC